MGQVVHRRPDALADQPLHHVAEAAVDLPDQVLGGQADIGEEQLGRVGLGLADLVQLAAPLEAGHGRLDREQGDALGALLGAGPGRDDDQVSGVAVGDEGLGAVQDPAVTVTDGGGLQRGQVRAARGLGQRERGDGLAGAEAREPALLLLLGAQIDQVGRDAVRVDADARGVGEGQLGQLLGEDQGEPWIADSRPRRTPPVRSARADPAGPARARPRGRIRGWRCAFPGADAACGRRRSHRYAGTPHDPRRKSSASSQRPSWSGYKLPMSNFTPPIGRRADLGKLGAGSQASGPDEPRPTG